MKTEVNANSNINEFPAKIALKGEIYTIDFDSIVDRKYSDDTVKVTHYFLPYISEKGKKMHFDREGIGHLSPGVIADGRTKFGKKVKKDHRDYSEKNINLVGEIL
jgi:hypothetical protein